MKQFIKEYTTTLCSHIRRSEMLYKNNDSAYIELCQKSFALPTRNRQGYRKILTLKPKILSKRQEWLFDMNIGHTQRLAISTYVTGKAHQSIDFFVRTAI